MFGKLYIEKCRFLVIMVMLMGFYFDIDFIVMKGLWMVAFL